MHSGICFLKKWKLIEKCFENQNSGFSFSERTGALGIIVLPSDVYRSYQPVMKDKQNNAC
jgi:hypothetical protein